jgi:hypothetical protein
VNSPSVPVSWGELLDKITILEIKRARIHDGAARRNVEKELDLLMRIAGGALALGPLDRLRRINQALWDIEDAIRAEDARGVFGPDFVRLARAVYRHNDERAAIKREINALLGSDLVEEKSYWSAAAEPPKSRPIGPRRYAIPS